MHLIISVSYYLLLAANRAMVSRAEDLLNYYSPVLHRYINCSRKKQLIASKSCYLPS